MNNAESRHNRANCIEGATSLDAYQYIWQFHDRGAFTFAQTLWEDHFDEADLKHFDLKPGKYFRFTACAETIVKVAMFARRLYAGYAEGLRLRLRWGDTRDRMLLFNEFRMFRPDDYVCRELEIVHEVAITVAELTGATAAYCEQVLLHVARMFNVRDPKTAVQQNVARFLRPGP